MTMTVRGAGTGGPSLVSERCTRGVRGITDEFVDQWSEEGEESKDTVHVGASDAKVTQHAAERDDGVVVAEHPGLFAAAHTETDQLHLTSNDLSDRSAAGGVAEACAALRKSKSQPRLACVTCSA